MIAMRLAKSEDYEALGKLYYLCWQQSHEDDDAVWGEEEDFIRYFKTRKCRDTIEGFLDNQMVGFCRYGNCKDSDVLPDTGEIYQLYVLKEYQRQGDGRRLLHEAIRRLRRADYNRVTMWVEEDDDDIIGFVNALGFKPDGAERMNVANVREVRYFRNI